MSEYSLDSLENVDESPSKRDVSTNNDKEDVCNLEAVKSAVGSVKDTSFYLNPILTISPRRRDTRDNVTGPDGSVRDGESGGRCTRTADGRNSIIASGGGFARRQECRDGPWLCIRRRDAVVDRGRCEKGDANRRRRRPRASRPTAERRRSPGARNSSSGRGPSGGVDADASATSADKKHGSMLASSWTRRPCGTSSYTELHRRRFGIPRYPRVRSPEGSTLSICGDSQLEELSLDEEGRASLPATSRDDSSELSFYRRIAEGRADLATRAIRSREIPRRGASNAVFPGARCERSVSDSKLKKLTYRPYTIEEYRSLSVPRPDRSLGPDKDQARLKREWLMRRRSYGDSVSARNCEQILRRARRPKDRENPRVPETDGTTRKSLLECQVRYPKVGVISYGASPSRKAGTLEKTPCFDRSLYSYAAPGDPYFEMSRQRHLQEKELADRLMRQALGS